MRLPWPTGGAAIRLALLSDRASASINRWLRRGPPRHYDGPEVGALVATLEERLALPETEWRDLPTLPETYYFPAPPTPHRKIEAAAQEVLTGRFRVASRFPVEDLGFPPAWGAEGREEDNWLSNLHGLEWTIPLLHAQATNAEAGYLREWVRLVEDWILRNPFRGAPCLFSWHDHATAKRLRLFAWVWEQYRRSPEYETGFARLFLSSVYQHARYHMDPRNYRPDSNHGLEAIGALWAAGVTFPMFKEAPAWEALAGERLSQWVGDNLSPEGFHLEQSPAYHWFVLLRLAAVDRFLRANGRTHPVVAEATARAAQAWPHLLQPNGTVPGVGDSTRGVPANWEAMLAQRWGRPAPAAAERQETSFISSPRAGYAIFRAGAGEADDTYVLFRSRAFLSPHCHYDALSFTLYGLGREWIVDPGYLNYHEWDPRRQYLRSARAHSLVLVRDRAARTGPSEVVAWEQTEEGASVVAYHDLPEGRHTRSVHFHPPRQMVIRDELQTSRCGPLSWALLYQVAPDLEVRVVSDREAHLVDLTGARCEIRASEPGRWEVVTAQTKPALQGWYSEGYGKWGAGQTLVFRPSPQARGVETTLTLRPR